MSTIAECKIESNTYNQRSTAKAVQDLEEGKMAFGRGMDKEISLESGWMDFTLTEMGKVIPSRPGKASVKLQLDREWA